MKTIIISLALLLSLRSSSQTNGVESEWEYPRISVSYNPIFFLNDYTIQADNNVNINTVTSGINLTNFDPSIDESVTNYIDFFTGHEFKLGIAPLKWIEFGIGYTRLINFVDIPLNATVSQDYSFTGYGTYTAHANLKFSYEPAYNFYLGYVKLNIPLFKNHNEDIRKQFSLNINPQYGFAVIKSVDAHYGIAVPVFPESYSIYGNIPTDPDITEFSLIKEIKPSEEVSNTKTNILSLGISLQCIKYISLYVDFSYYLSFNQDKLYINEYLFQEGSTMGTHVRFPGTITNIMAIKTGISIQIPLKSK